MPASKRPISLSEVRSMRQELQELQKKRVRKLRPLERLAVWITERVGSMGFFLLILTWTVMWLGWNILAPKKLQFDPPMAFVFWLFISNVIQILLMPLIMVGQNVQGAAADTRAQYDLDVNVKSEREIEVILSHLEYQNELLITMMKKVGADVSEALSPDDDKPSTGRRGAARGRRKT